MLVRRGGVHDRGDGNMVGESEWSECGTVFVVVVGRSDREGGRERAVQ